MAGDRLDECYAARLLERQDALQAEANARKLTYADDSAPCGRTETSRTRVR